MSAEVDALVIGGGFYGCYIAKELKARMGSVVLVEQEADLLQRASFTNQARIHQGYHYPRSLQTGYRSRLNFDRFVQEFPGCVMEGIVHLYCIARERSKVSPRHFERFCQLIGAPCLRAKSEYEHLFNPRLIDAVYEVREHVFDAAYLRDQLRATLDQAGVEVRLAMRAEMVEADGIRSRVSFSGGSEITARYVINCTYSGLRQIKGTASRQRAILKHEIAELALIEPPEELCSLGITVMCGPFFSVLPFPARRLHSLSHVRYTPHCSWTDTNNDAPEPYAELCEHHHESQARLMLCDAQRYIPSLGAAKIVDSMIEVKTILARNEIDDGRPILVERSDTPNPIWSVLGGKIDNIYDAIERLKSEGL
jgi:glycine/D-amino acid oxidase-like deaminating enzyme